MGRGLVGIALGRGLVGIALGRGLVGITLMGRGLVGIALGRGLVGIALGRGLVGTTLGVYKGIPQQKGNNWAFKFEISNTVLYLKLTNKITVQSFILN